MPVIQHAYAGFWAAEREGDFDPDVLTERLGLEPTETHQRGEPRSEGRAWRRTSWRYGVTASDQLQWDELVAPILTAFHGRETAVHAAMSDLRLTGALVIVTEMHAERMYAGSAPDKEIWGVPTPGAGLSAERLQRLADLGFSLDVDMYVFPTEAMENAE